jgi:hypothetical protein
LSLLWRITELLRLSPRGEWVQAGSESDFFVALDASRVEFKPGVTIEKQTRPGGGVALLLTTGTGAQASLYCRCPKGYRGRCDEIVEGPFAQCGGKCTHEEVLTLTTDCNWFRTSRPKFSLSGLARRLRT